MTAKAKEPIPGWDQLGHAGLLLDGPRLHSLTDYVPEALDEHVERRLRQRAAAALGGVDDPGTTSGTSQFVSFVLEEVCGFDGTSGSWQRGSQVPRTHGRRAVTGEIVKPRHLWNGPHGASLPVFIDDAKRIGIGRGRRIVSQVLGWLRAGSEHLALVTNGRQWRLVFAGLDYDASCEWDTELWFEEGKLAAQVTALRSLLGPKIWTPGEEGAASPLLQAIRDTRKGQADLSEVLGERVREAVEILVQSHGEALKQLAGGDDGVPAADIYRAACRIAMRAVVILFAESRRLLPRNNPVYNESYGLNGLRDQLERRDARGESMGEVFGAWPRILALFQLVSDGSHHPDLPVTAYGGELFAPGRSASGDGVSRALHVFETACFGGEVVSDRNVYNMLHLLTRTKARIRQGRGGMWVTVPVDFSDLSSEYIGIVYEGLLDYELKTAPEGDPVVFLSVGDRPALPLSRLEAMDKKAIRGLFDKLKKDSSADQGGEEAERADDASEAEGEAPDTGPKPSEDTADERRTYRTRAEQWARRAAEVAGLVRKPRGRMTPERRLAFERKLGETARKLVHQNVLPGEWYLARWGGTRKGSGSFYTRPGLAVPTVQRTLRPLAYDPPAGMPPEEARHAPAAEWTPKLPEEILSLKACDPACGSGSFALAALRFLTEALYASLRHHGRIEASGNESLVWMLGIKAGEGDESERLSDEQIPCPPDNPDFESLLKPRLRRHVVERCIYAVDLDPLAVELCRLSLWIETMDRDLPFGFLDHKVKCGNALVGAWFDQFQHYPAMAWKNREGGDKTHSNGVHFKKNARGKAIKDFHKNRLTPDMRRFLEGRTLFQEDLLEKAVTAHDDAIEILAYMHELPIHDAAERADVYRKELLGSPEWRSLKDAMDLWCACWFWPADEIEHAPLPTRFADPPEETRAVAKEVAARHRFFHWELEFPDVFCEEGAGFDAVLGNPPWENYQPNPEEFFSNEDPLFRTYGRPLKRVRQREMFQSEASVERRWLDYVGRFKEFSNWVRNCANPFGDPEARTRNTTSFSLGRGGKQLHQRWSEVRQADHGFSDAHHVFRLQMGRVFSYQLFLEQSLALMRDGGRCGLVIPSGVYSDAWSRPLRIALLERCRWEWLFGFENGDKIFPIHRSYKFNPVVIEKGGSTDVIQTGFMRRDLEDWAHAEDIATPYTRAQVERFSPNSYAILEIQSQRDLEILKKIYAKSVLLGKDGPDGWGIKYRLEFMLNTHAHLFAALSKWIAKGYVPDEYGRWLLGDWRPIEELWAELGNDPNRPVSAEIEPEDWLFDKTASPERRHAEAQLVHGHLLKPGDVARTNWAVRCAQPPYDRLPVPRVEIPPGIVLSRDATKWIREGARIEDVALPLYQGTMVHAFVPSAKGWCSGTGLKAQWDPIDIEELCWNPQFLMSQRVAGITNDSSLARAKIGFRDVARSTDARSFIGSYLPQFPCSGKVPVLHIGSGRSSRVADAIALLNSFVFDWVVRQRLGAAKLAWHMLAETGLPPMPHSSRLFSEVNRLNLFASVFSPVRVMHGGAMTIDALAPAERIRVRIILDAASCAMYGCDMNDLRHILRDSDLPASGVGLRLLGRTSALDMRGFWRVDRDKDPEIRHTVLTLLAFHDLESKISEAKGNRDEGLQAFLAQNEGEGWLLPETVRLADYDLGHDGRAYQHQPVASRLGPRFFDWQLIRSPEESWRQCHLHARNLLGRADYAQLIERLDEDEPDPGASGVTANDDPRWTRNDGSAQRAAEPKRDYTPAAPAAPPQTEILRKPQADLFE